MPLSFGGHPDRHRAHFIASIFCGAGAKHSLQKRRNQAPLEACNDLRVPGRRLRIKPNVALKTPRKVNATTISWCFKPLPPLTSPKSRTRQ
jgi:hypothetical protein